jgi:hypothetical protein
VSNKPGHRGEREVSRKTIARGMPGETGVTVVTTLVCLFFITHEAAGASSARHSLRPLLLGAAKQFCKTRAYRAARSRSHILNLLFENGIENSGTKPMSSRTSESSERDPGPICGRPPWHKSFLMCNRIACVHMSGLLMRSFCDRWPRWFPRHEFQSTTRPLFGQWVPRICSHPGSIDPTIYLLLQLRFGRWVNPPAGRISYAAAATAASIRALS